MVEEGLKRGEFQSPRLRGVWMDGFSDFSKLQLAFIEFLARHADEMTVTLTLDQDPFKPPLFQFFRCQRMPPSMLWNMIPSIVAA